MAAEDNLETILALGREYGAALVEISPDGAIKVIFNDGSAPIDGELPDDPELPPSDDPYERLFKGDTPKFNRE